MLKKKCFQFYLELRQKFFSHSGGSRVILPGLCPFEDLINIHFLESRRLHEILSL